MISYTHDSPNYIDVLACRARILYGRRCMYNVCNVLVSYDYLCHVTLGTSKTGMICRNTLVVYDLACQAIENG